MHEIPARILPRAYLSITRHFCASPEDVGVSFAEEVEIKEQAAVQAKKEADEHKRKNEFVDPLRATI